MVQAIVEEDEEVEEEEDPSQPLPPETLESEAAQTGDPSSDAVSDTDGQDGGSFELLSDEAKVLEVSQRISDGKRVVRASQPTASSTPVLYRVLLALLTLTVSYLSYDFKQEASQIGFCETGQSSNDVLRSFQSQRAAVDLCNRQNRTYLYLPEPDSTQSVEVPIPEETPSAAPDTWAFSEEQEGKQLCPAPPLLPIPHPDTCTPCPAHAVCSPSVMTCETGYLIRPHPLLFFLPLSPAPNSPHAQNSYAIPSLIPSAEFTGTTSELIYKSVSHVLDGLPGMGTVALPPRCVEDPKRKERVGALGKAVETLLASHRGRLICEGEVPQVPAGTEAEEARKWGFEMEDLKEHMKTSGMKKKLAVCAIVKFGSICSDLAALASSHGSVR